MIRAAPTRHAHRTPPIRQDYHYGRIIRLRGSVCRNAGPHTAELVLIARNEAALRQLAAALEKRHSGLHASVLPCDLADEASLNMLISRLDSLPPGRTLLINNAGAGDYGDFSDGRWEKFVFCCA